MFPGYSKDEKALTGGNVARFKSKAIVKMRHLGSTTLRGCGGVSLYGEKLIVKGVAWLIPYLIDRLCKFFSTACHFLSDFSHAL